MKTKLTSIAIGLGLVMFLFFVVIWDHGKRPNEQGRTQPPTFGQRNVVSTPEPSGNNPSGNSLEASGILQLPLIRIGLPKNIDREIVRSINQATSGGNLFANSELGRDYPESWLNPGGNLFLYSRGGEPMKIYNMSIELKAVLPRVVMLDKTRYEISRWVWKNNDVLVGMGLHDINENKMDEEVVSVDVAAIFMVDIRNPEVVINLESPQIAKGRIVRLDGISADGGLILSEALPSNWMDFYRSGPDYDRNQYQEGERQLGIFDLKR